MASTGMQVLGLCLCCAGLLGAIVSCALPMWKVTAFIGYNIVVAQTIWEGLWMNCVVQSTGQMQCKIYDSMLALGQDLQAARALSIATIAFTGLGILVSTAGAKCTTCIDDDATKSRVTIGAGIVVLLAGAMQLVPTSWTANQVVRDFYNPTVPGVMKREIGASIYIGWAAGVVLVLGGALLCMQCPPKREKHAARRPRVGHLSSVGSSKSNYV